MSRAEAQRNGRVTSRKKKKASIRTSTTPTQPSSRRRSRTTHMRKRSTKKHMEHLETTSTVVFYYRKSHFQNWPCLTSITSTILVCCSPWTQMNDNFVVNLLSFLNSKEVRPHIYFINKCKFKKWKFFNLSTNKGTVDSTQTEFNH